MNLKQLLIFLFASSLISCNQNLTEIDFDSLPIECMNPSQEKEWNDYDYKTLSTEMRISSSTNNVNLASDLVEWSDSLLIELGKPISNANVETSEDWNALSRFTLGVITNEATRNKIELNLDNSQSDILCLEHIDTEFAIADDEYIKEGANYRYSAMIKYHFKMSINCQNELCEGMKHLVLFDDYLIYSPTKL